MSKTTTCECGLVYRTCDKKRHLTQKPVTQNVENDNWGCEPDDNTSVDNNSDDFLDGLNNDKYISQTEIDLQNKQLELQRKEQEKLQKHNVDSATYIFFIAKTGTGNYNMNVIQNDSCIFYTNTDNWNTYNGLFIGPWTYNNSPTPGGIRINNTHLQIYGGLKANIKNNNITAPNVLAYDTSTKEIYYTTTLPTGPAGPAGPQGATGTVATAFAYYSTYNDGTFTNTSGQTIIVSVSATWGYSTNSTGLRLWKLEHSVMGYLSNITIDSNSTGNTIQSLSSTFSLLANEYFRFLATQISGASLNTTDANYTNCTITRLM